MKMNKTWNQGFTLIELMIVIAIIGLLAALLIPALIRSKGAAQQALAITMIHDVGLALTMYHSDNAAYPDSSADFSTKSLVDALQQPNGAEGGKPYFLLNKTDLNQDGVWVSALRCPYYYRNNEFADSGSNQGYNKYGYDLWSMDYQIINQLTSSKTSSSSGGSSSGGGGSTSTSKDPMAKVCNLMDPLEISKTTKVKNW